MLDNTTLFIGILLCVLIAVSITITFIVAKRNPNKLSPTEIEAVLLENMSMIVLTTVEEILATIRNEEDDKVIARRVSDRIFDKLSHSDSPKIVIAILAIVGKDDFYKMFEHIFLSNIINVRGPKATRIK